MPRFREEEGKARFAQAIELRPEDVEAAKAYLMGRVTGSAEVDGTKLINDWWKARKTPPVEQLMLDDDYGFDRQCVQAARYWESRLAGAQALRELVGAGHLDREGAATRTETIHQRFTTVTPESSGGTSGGWNLGEFAIEHPARVKKGPYSKPWAGPTSAASDFEREGPTATAARPLGVIANPRISEQAFEALNEMETALRALIESGTLTPESRRLLNEQAFELIDRLRDLLRIVTASEVERRGLIRKAATAGGELMGTLSSAARLAAPFTGLLASAPEAIANGHKMVASVMANLG